VVISIVATFYLTVFGYANTEPEKTPTGWY